MRFRSCISLALVMASSLSLAALVKDFFAATSRWWKRQRHRTTQWRLPPVKQRPRIQVNNANRSGKAAQELARSYNRPASKPS